MNIMNRKEAIKQALQYVDNTDVFTELLSERENDIIFRTEHKVYRYPYATLQMDINRFCGQDCGALSTKKCMEWCLSRIVAFYTKYKQLASTINIPVVPPFKEVPQTNDSTFPKNDAYQHVQDEIVFYEDLNHNTYEA